MYRTVFGDFIIMKLDTRDWNQRGGDCARDFIEALKLIIPKEDRSYDDESKQWIIKKVHAESIEELRKRYLVDGRQMEMF